MENIVVIGGGLMGTSVTWKLAEQGQQVLLIEQQGKKYENGSSLGTARIARSLGPKKDVFSFVHNRTIIEVEKLIYFLNEASESDKHSMDDVYTTSPVSYLYTKSQSNQIDKLRYKKQKRDYGRGSGDSAFRKFGVTLKPNQVLVREYRKYSGTINPEALIKKLRQGIKLKEGRIKYSHKVTKLVKTATYFELTILNTITNKTQILQAKKVVVAAGPYTVQVLKDFAPYFNRIITPKRVLVSFFKIAEEKYKQLSPLEKKNMLVAQPMFSQIGKEYFSMVEKIEKKGSPLFKAGGHKIRRNIIDIDKVWDSEPPKKELKWIKKKFRKYLEMLEIFLQKKDIVRTSYYNCVYSLTRSEIPLVTPIFNKYGSLDPNIIVIGGMSGIGAKGCLGYGVIGANLITGKKGESSKIYQKATKAFGNPSVRLYTRRPRRGRLF